MKLLGYLAVFIAGLLIEAFFASRAKGRLRVEIASWKFTADKLLEQKAALFQSYTNELLIAKKRAAVLKMLLDMLMRLREELTEHEEKERQRLEAISRG